MWAKLKAETRFHNSLVSIRAKGVGVCVTQREGGQLCPHLCDTGTPSDSGLSRHCSHDNWTL